jgi:catechol 2,3-dioxygenase-like lactoylglutathione lyase family enzyme
MAQLEHVNVTVSDPAKTAALLGEIFGWHVRWSGPSKMGGNTVHVGSEDTYVAVYTYDGKPQSAPDAGLMKSGLNHIGVLVDDLDAVELRVRAAGLEPFNHQTYDPGRRFYFLDGDGVEYEVVSYA